MAYEAYEAYESNNGTLAIFAIEERDGEIVPVWGQTYYGNEDEAAQDWCGLVVQGLNPLRECWEGMSADDLRSAYYCDQWDHMIADSTEYDLPLGIDIDRCQGAGKLFAIAAGAAYRCPECGEVCQTVRDVTYPNDWAVPRCCECCGASLTSYEL